MRFPILLLLSALSFSAYAAETPPKLEPLPPPPAFDPHEAPPDEPQVTIVKEAGQTVEEFRANGKLYMIKVTPKHGKSYYLVDELGDGKFARQESLDSGLRVPQWIIHSF